MANMFQAQQQQSSTPMMNIIAPDLATQQLQIQRQQQMAQMLMQQGTQPSDTQVIGGWAVKQSPFQHLAKLAQVLAGESMLHDSDEKNGAINTQMGQRLGDYVSQLTGGANKSSFPQFVGGQGQPVDQGQAQSDNPQAMIPADPRAKAAQLAMLLGKDQVASNLLENIYNQTDQQKNDQYSGVTPSQRNALATQFDLRANQVRAGLDENGQPKALMVAPDIAGNIQTAVNKDGTYTSTGVPGVPDATTALTEAQKLGVNKQTLAPVDQSITNADGTTQPRSVAETLGFPKGTLLPSPTPNFPMQKGQDDRLTILQNEKKSADNTPQDNAAIDRQISALSPSPQGVGMPTAQKPMTDSNVEQAKNNFTNLSNINTNAPVILDALNDVKKYSKGAIIGAEADSRQYMNGLKTLVPGFSTANDEKTNTDLFNKSANRLVAASSNVPGATDALRTISAAMNPNEHMNPDAVNNAVDKLTSIIKMQKDNLNVISPYQQKNDLKNVLDFHNSFNSHADPVMWQLKDMSPEDQAKYINSMSPSDAKNLLNNRKIIMNLGGLQ